MGRGENRHEGNTDYQDFFKKRRQLERIKNKTFLRKFSKPGRPRFHSSIWMVFIACGLAGGSIWYLCGGEQQAGELLSRLEISVFGEAGAAESTETKSKKEEKPAADKPPEGAVAKVAPKAWSEEEIALFTKLEARKKQLDTREAELTKLEEDLQKTKDEIEKRLQKLEEVRSTISNKLEDRVKVDNQKVETLVNVYANMKPVQAAKVIESIDEDLAVEVLAKMKNKSAAEILNLMSPDKAKKISERFAGFRSPALAGN